MVLKNSEINFAKMSDSDIYFESDDDDDGIEFDEKDAIRKAEEEEAIESPAFDLERAIDDIGFDNEHAVFLLKRILDNEESTIDIKMKALSKLTKLSATMENVELLDNCMTQLFENVNSENITSLKLEKIIKKVISLSGSNLPNFLSQTLLHIDPTRHLYIFLEIRLRQVELAFQDNNLSEVEKSLQDLASYIPLTPTSDDKMNILAFRYIISLLLLYDSQKDSEKSSYYYSLATEMKISIPDQYRAVLKEIEARNAFNQGDYITARTLYGLAFRWYNISGNSRKFIVLPYYGLSSMLCHDTINPFEAPEITIYKNTQIAPFFSLMIAYFAGDVIAFNSNLKEAQKCLLRDPCENELQWIQEYVLRQSIEQFVIPYSRVSFAYIADEFGITKEKVKLLIMDAINEGKILGCIDLEQEILIANQKSNQSADNNKILNQLLLSIEITQKELRKRLKTKNFT